MYHYTSEKGYSGILNSMEILPSLKESNPKDARFGDGQYLSDIVPGSKSPAQLSRVFLGMPWAVKRFTHYVHIDTIGLIVTYGRVNVYIIINSEPLDITDRLVRHGRN